MLPLTGVFTPQMAQNLVTGLKEPCFPSHTRPPHLLTGPAAITTTVRGLWVLALEGPAPPEWAGTLVACTPALTTLPAGPQLCGVMTSLASFIIYHSIISIVMFHTGDPGAHDPGECCLGQWRVGALA